MEISENQFFADYKLETLFANRTSLPPVSLGLIAELGISSIVKVVKKKELYSFCREKE